MNSLKAKFGPEVKILQAVDAYDGARVLVIGDPDNGVYEWAIERNGKVEEHSDLSYGNTMGALRDGLIAYWPPMGGSSTSKESPLKEWPYCGSKDAHSEGCIGVGKPRFVPATDYHDDLIEECAEVCDSYKCEHPGGRIVAGALARAIRNIKFGGSTPLGDAAPSVPATMLQEACCIALAISGHFCANPDEWLRGHEKRLRDLEKIAKGAMRSSIAALPEGFVKVEKLRGMQEPLRKIGNRLLQEFQGRFSIGQPRQFTDNERQVIVQAMKTMLQAVEGGPFDEPALLSATVTPILDEALLRCAQHHLDDAMLDSPCIFCGYNGAGYWQKGTHAKNCRWHSVGGYDDRHKSLQTGATTDGTTEEVK